MSNRRSCLLGLFLALSSFGCEDTPSGPAGADEPSPNASILPSPLASTPRVPLSDAGRSASADDADSEAPDGADESSEPVAYPTSRPLKSDAPSAADRTGLVVAGDFLWYPWVEAGGQAPEANLRLPVEVELSALGRMRFVVKAEGLHLAPGTELRSQVDRYGHVLVWPDLSAYRVLQLGSVRAFLQEHRGDVSPLLEATIKVAESSGSPNPTETLSIETEMGTLVMKQEETHGLGGSAALLCRLLTELVLAEADGSVCREGWLPVRADYSWNEGGRFGFASTSQTRVVDLKISDFSIPPDSAGLRAHDVPPLPKALVPDKAKLNALIPKNGAEPPDPQTDPPERGIILTNRFGTPRYVSLMGQPVAWVPPQKSVHLGALKKGSYDLYTRDFLGVEVPSRQAVSAPGRAQLGHEADSPRAATR